MGTDVVLISKTSKALLTELVLLLYYELISSAWVQMIFVVCPALNFNLNKNAHPQQWHALIRFLLFQKCKKP